MQDCRTSRSSHRSPQANQDALDPFTRGYVRKRARGLIGKYGFRRCDSDELEQSLYLKLAGRLDQADPDDPKWKAFVAKTVGRHIASMIRDREAAKRDHRRVCSIHVVIGADEEGPVELAATLLENETPAKRSREQRSEQETADLRMDVATCIDGLCDERYREFCDRLKRDSVSQVARDMGVPRTTLNAWLAKIRSRFEEFGLGGYMDRSSSVG